MDCKNNISEALLPRNRSNDIHHFQANVCRTSTSCSPSQASRATSTNDSSDAASLAHAFDRMNFDEQPLMAERMFLSLDVIIQHAAEEHEIDVDIQELHLALRQADQDSRHGSRDLDVLVTLRNVLDQLLTAESEYFVQAATILANASRDGKSAVTNRYL
ncbi:MAG: hypothetical protein Q9209_007573 [Squamulea sp. 1 TL-2023]